MKRQRKIEKELKTGNSSDKIKIRKEEKTKKQARKKDESKKQKA